MDDRLSRENFWLWTDDGMALAVPKGEQDKGEANSKAREKPEKECHAAFPLRISPGSAEEVSGDRIASGRGSLPVAAAGAGERAPDGKLIDSPAWSVMRRPACAKGCRAPQCRACATASELAHMCAPGTYPSPAN